MVKLKNQKIMECINKITVRPAFVMDEFTMTLLHSELFKKKLFFYTNRNSFCIEKIQTLNDVNSMHIERILNSREVEVSQRIKNLLRKTGWDNVHICYGVEFEHYNIRPNSVIKEWYRKHLVFLYSPHLPFLPGYYYPEVRKKINLSEELLN